MSVLQSVINIGCSIDETLPSLLMIRLGFMALLKQWLLTGLLSDSATIAASILTFGNPSRLNTHCTD